MSSRVFVGIRGCVVALDRATGAELWRTKLKGADFVNVSFLDGQLYATTRGEAFCLDDATGQVRWHNRLSGLGWGLVTIASAGEPPGAQTAVAAEKRRREHAAATRGAATT